VNTLALSVIERRREIGMLRAVGMQRKQVRRTIYLESLLIAVFGATLGVALGLAFGALFSHDLADQGLDQLSIPWSQGVLFLVLAAIVGVLAALGPSTDSESLDYKLRQLPSGKWAPPAYLLTPASACCRVAPTPDTSWRAPSAPSPTSSSARAPRSVGANEGSDPYQNPPDR